MAKPKARLLALALVLGAMGTGVSAQTASQQPDIPSPNLKAVAKQPGRLHLEMWPENGWVVQQYERLIEIRLPNERRSVVPNSAVVQQLAGYLSDLTVTSTDGGQSLMLTLDCDCIVALAGDGNSVMTIDIVGSANARAADRSLANANGPAPGWAPMPSSKPETVETTDAGGVDVDAAREHLMAQLLRAAEAGFVELDGPLDQENSAPDPAAAPDAEPVPDKKTAEIDPAVRHDGDTSDLPDTRGATDHALNEIPANADVNPQTSEASESATQAEGGHKQAMPDHSNDTEHVAERDVDAMHGAEGQSTGPTDADTSPADSENLQASVDPDSEPQCFPNEAFEFADVVHDVVFVERIGELRRQLVGEFDRPESNNALGLAKLYVSARFGEEARGILADFTTELPEAKLYHELSLLLDGHALPATASVLKADCVGDQSIWRALAQAMAGAGSEAVSDESISGRALERLPVHLREFFAAWIGNAAADIGDWDNARRMEAMAVRAARSLPDRESRSLILSAKLADWHGEPRRAVELLNAARSLGQEDADEVLLLLAQRTLRDPQYIGTDTVALQRDLGALARSAMGTEIGQKAFELEVRLHDRTGTRGESIALLAHGVEGGLYPEDEQYALLSDIVTTPSDDGLSSPLAVLYMENPDRFAPALALPGFRRGLAQSMAALGVPALATEVLTTQDYTDADLAETIAQSFLDADDPRQAIEIAGQMPEGIAKDTLLGRALMQAGMLDRAQAHMSTADARRDTPADLPIETLDQQMQAALSAGDISLALSTRKKAFDIAPDLDGADELAMLALEAGEDALPDQAVQFLEQQDPERLEALNAMFRPTIEADDLESPEGVADYLKSLDAEESAIRGMLTDG